MAWTRLVQASKLDKLATTGRFGLGFNAAYHFTDLPSVVSGEHLIMFDPNTKYVPGATSVNPGIKVRALGYGVRMQCVVFFYGVEGFWTLGSLDAVVPLRK